MKYEKYVNPLQTRYSSQKMQYIFSEKNRIIIWRRLWIALAKAQKELGLPITDEQIRQMEENVENIDFERIREIEHQTRHDVMAHIKGFGEVAPKAKGIIHLGATSCYVTDNADLIIIKQALDLIKKRLITLISNLKEFCIRYKDIVCPAYTHFQIAQPTTMGKRGTLWLFDLYLDFKEIDTTEKILFFRSAKGTTGTQASFLALFNNDYKKVELLEKKIAEYMGFKEVIPVCGQTYTRKIDSRVINTLAQIAQSCSKFSYDIRLLQHTGHILEGFSKNQVGSSAMPYKRNPMKAERMTALSRFVITNVLNISFTHATQWLERSLDDSANRRLVIPQIFLAVDGILLLYLDIIKRIQLNLQQIKRDIERYYPFLSTETFMMRSVLEGADRQNIHEAIRKASLEAYEKMGKGEDVSLWEILEKDGTLKPYLHIIEDLRNQKNIAGLASVQTERFIEQYINPLLEENSSLIEKYSEEVKV